MKDSVTPRLLLLSASVVGISLLHYLTPLSLAMLHDVFQRLYYIPIILASFWFGLRGGLACAIVVSVLYAPHILFQWGGNLNMELEKYLEIVLYNIVGAVTGFLSQRERTYAARLRETARGLEESFTRLQGQADLIIEIEEQLRQAERLSTVGELSAAMAHEVRNPLGSIRGAAEILMDDYRPGDRKYEFCQILVNESERLNRVVEEYLQLARRRPEGTTRCDPAEELAAVGLLLSPEAKRRGVRLHIDPGPLPLVNGDGEKLRQAFLNIILNGLQATPAGGSVTVGAFTRETGTDGSARVTITITDTGSGIAHDDLERIFDTFYTTKAGGTGLGLAITRKIVEGCGGRIEAESRVGSGSTFRVTIPVWTQSEERP